MVSGISRLRVEDHRNLEVTDVRGVNKSPQRFRRKRVTRGLGEKELPVTGRLFGTYWT